MTLSYCRIWTCHKALMANLNSCSLQPQLMHLQRGFSPEPCTRHAFCPLLPLHVCRSSRRQNCIFLEKLSKQIHHLPRWSSRRSRDPGHAGHLTHPAGLAVAACFQEQQGAQLGFSAAYRRSPLQPSAEHQLQRTIPALDQAGCFSTPPQQLPGRSEGFHCSNLGGQCLDCAEKAPAAAAAADQAAC